MVKFEINWLEDRSDEAILAEIRRVAALMPNNLITKKEFNSLSKISGSAVEKRFGSWSEATRRAGLPNALPVYSDDAILKDLRRVSELLPSDPLTSAFYKVQGRYSLSCVKRRFGGWGKALNAAGIGSRFGGPLTTERMKTQPGRAMSNEEILTKIREIAARLDKDSLSGAEIVANSEISLSQLLRRFGGTSKAFSQAGIVQVSHGRRYTEDEVFENLLEVWTHYGRPPTVSEMDNLPSTIGKNAYLHRYGGWRKALKAFVERANSEVNNDPAIVIEQDPSKLVNRVDPTDIPATSAIGYIKAQSINQIAASPRNTKPATTNIKPEERRDPSIGLRFKVLQRDGFRCLLCGRSPATELGCELHIDHIIPFSKGGKTTLENLQTLCSKCNVGKSNRPTTNSI